MVEVYFVVSFDYTTTITIVTGFIKEQLIV